MKSVIRGFLAVLAFGITQSNAADQGFRFDPSRAGKFVGVCANSRGEPGTNRGEWMECGNPTTGPDGFRLEYFKSISRPNKSLINIVLDGASINSGDFSNSDFSYALTAQTKFNQINLKGAKFNQLNGQSVEFYNSDLSGASLKKAILLGAEITWSNLQGANFDGAIIGSARFMNNNLQNIDFTKSDMRELTPDLPMTFIGNDMRGAKISRINSWFRNNDLRDADLSNVQSGYNDLPGCLFNDNTKLPFGKQEALNRKMIYRP